VELKKLAQLQKMWALRKPILDAHILSLQENMQKLELEIDGIVMEKLKGGVSNPRPR
jgi:site-specific DNA recombinase